MNICYENISKQFRTARGVIDALHALDLTIEAGHEPDWRRAANRCR
jgi:hypothetical protein